MPIRFVRHDRVGSIKYGDIVSGNIEQHAAHDRFTFTADAGDVIQIYGPGCDLDSMFISFIDPTATTCSARSAARDLRRKSRRPEHTRCS